MCVGDRWAMPFSGSREQMESMAVVMWAGPDQGVISAGAQRGLQEEWE